MIEKNKTCSKNHTNNHNINGLIQSLDNLDTYYADDKLYNPKIIEHNNNIYNLLNSTKK